MRAEGPACYVEPWRAWCITHFAEVSAGFRDARLSANRSESFARSLPPELREHLLPLIRNLASWALLVDPPDHTRLRGLISKAFTPRVVQQLRPKIEELSRMLIDDAITRSKDGEIDIIRDLAEPLPVLVIGDLLGLPREDRHLLKEWSDAIAAMMGAARPTVEKAVAACQAIAKMERYFADVIALRRRSPSDDLLSLLVTAENEGGLLSEQELLSTCAMVLFGGHETTTNLIGNGLYALLEHPEQLVHLRATPNAMPGAVEEFLRFDSPVQRMGRVTREEITIGNARIPAGERIYLVMGSAHRDPAAFDEPDRLNVLRGDVRHLGLGLGAHYCVGAALGRLEAQTALNELLFRFPTIKRRQDVEWLDNTSIRGLHSLPVTAMS